MNTYRVTSFIHARVFYCNFLLFVIFLRLFLVLILASLRVLMLKRSLGASPKTNTARNTKKTFTGRWSINIHVKTMSRRKSTLTAFTLVSRPLLVSQPPYTLTQLCLNHPFSKIKNTSTVISVASAPYHFCTKFFFTPYLLPGMTP